MRLDELEVLRIEVSPETRSRHLEMLTVALRQEPMKRARRPLTLILAAALLLFPLAAVASERSIPGELLHPIKRFFEPARLLIDGDVEARHRVEELEILIERQGARNLIERQLAEAEAAVGDRPLLRQRLQQAWEDLARGQAASDEMRPTTATTGIERPPGVASTTQPVGPVTPTTSPPPRSTTTAVSSPERTTTTIRDSTRP